MAGRNQSKLESAKKEIEKYEMYINNVPTITATLDDPKSLDEMTS